MGRSGRSHPLGVSLAGKTRGAGGGSKGTGGTDLVVVDEEPGKDKAARQVVLGWPGKLSAPVLDGTRATYRDAAPGLDVVVESRRSGFEQLTVIRDEAALDALVASAGDGVVSWSLPVKTKGLTARAEEDGSVSFVEARVWWSHGSRCRWRGTRRWTRRRGEGQRLHGWRGRDPEGQGAGGVDVDPDRQWLTDPARVFPITVDPTYATGANSYPLFDTYVQRGNTYDSSAESELRVGTSDGGGAITARSFLKFGFTNFKNLSIMSASLSLYEKHSYSCTAKPFYVHSSAAVADPAALTWGNQPAAGTQYGSLSVAKGFSSSCAAGRVSVPITGLVSWWASNAYSTGWLRLSASETDSYGWKKFASSETSTDPYITFTYNRKPNAASAPTLTDGYTYTPPGGTAAVYTKDTTPEFATVATDPDLNGWSSTIEVHSSKTVTASTKVAFCSTSQAPYATSGATAKCTVPTALVNNTEYYVRAAVVDDQGLWNGTWSTWTTLRVATTAPAAPVISCPAPYANGYTAVGVPSAPVVCTVSAVGAGWSAPSKITVTQNGVTTAYGITPSSNPAVAKTTVTIPTTAGTHSLSAVASTPSLVSSPAATYAVIFGPATMASPVDGASSTGTVPVRATMSKPSGTLTAMVQYRLAGDDAAEWVDGDALTVDATGANAEISGGWNIADIEGTNISGRVPVTFQARVCLSTGAGCAATTAPVTITRLPNALGSGYPTDSSSGAGTVALFTGEFSTSASDVSVGGIGVGRSYESFNGDQTVNDTVRGVFGPGWTGSFGEVSGRAGWTIHDTTDADGRISITSPDGSEVLTFARADGAKSYTLTSTPVEYVPSNDAADDAQISLKLSGTASAAKLELTEEEGTVTVWAPTAALPTTLPLTASATWAPSAVLEPGDSTTSHTFYYPDPANPARVGRIVDVPEGRSSTDCPATGTWTTAARGCVRVDITYGTTNTAPEAAGQVKTITASLWNPVTSSMDNNLPMAAYEYDTLKRLVQVTDQRTTPALATRYGWDGTSTRLSTITPAGLAPYRQRPCVPDAWHVVGRLVGASVGHFGGLGLRNLGRPCQPRICPSKKDCFVGQEVGGCTHGRKSLEEAAACPRSYSSNTVYRRGA